MRNRALVHSLWGNMPMYPLGKGYSDFKLPEISEPVKVHTQKWKRSRRRINKLHAKRRARRKQHD